MRHGRVVGVMLVAATLGSTSLASGKAPELLPVQGYLTDESGVALDGDVAITFRIYAAATGGTALITDAQMVLVEGGYFTAYVGDSGPLDLALFRDHGSLYISVQVEVDPEMSPRMALGSVPYAGYAEYSGQVSWDDLAEVPPALADGTDNDTLYTAGVGLSLSAENEFSVLQSTVEGWARGVCYDSAAELGAALSDVYATIGHTHPVTEWDDIVGVPPALADGDADTLDQLTCESGQRAQWNGAEGRWACVEPSVGVLPAGMIVPFAGAKLPSGWLGCDGSAVSRVTYAGLYEAIGVLHGEGDGVTTFNLPDYRGRFLRGVDGEAGRDPDRDARTAGVPGGAVGNAVGSVQGDATGRADSAFSCGLAGKHGHGESSVANHNHAGTTGAREHSHVGGNHEHWYSTPLRTWDILDFDLVWNSVRVSKWSLDDVGTYSTGTDGGGHYHGGGSHDHVVNADGGHAHTIYEQPEHGHPISGGDSETRPANAYVLYIIKY